MEWTPVSWTPAGKALPCLALVMPTARPRQHLLTLTAGERGNSTGRTEEMHCHCFQGHHEPELLPWDLTDHTGTRGPKSGQSQGTSGHPGYRAGLRA